MKTNINKIISVILILSFVLGFEVGANAKNIFENETELNIMFFGEEVAGASTVSNEKDSYSYLISKYVGETYNNDQANVFDNSGTDGFKQGYYALDSYGESFVPTLAYLSFNGDENEIELAYAEGIIRRLYEKNNSIIVNFILLPTKSEKSNITPIMKLSKAYGIYVHDIRNDEQVLNKYDKFIYDEMFYGNNLPNELGSDAIARMVINNLKTEAWYNKLKWNEKAIYEKIISGFVNGNVNVDKIETEIFVSSDGDDKNTGTLEKPIKTFDKIMELIANAPENSDIKVYFREGTYNIGEKVELESNNAKNKHISFSAYNNERVVLTNSLYLTPSMFSVVRNKDILERLPQNAQGKVLQLDLNTLNLSDEGFVRYGIWQYTPSALQFIVDNKIQKISRWPNNDFEKIASVSARTIGVNTDRLNRWSKAKECWLYGYLGNYWADDSIKISNINVNEKTISVDNNPRYAFAVNQEWAIINLLEEIDMPGEWFLDHETNILYYFPVDDFENKEIRISNAKESSFVLSNVNHITFKDLIIDGSRSMAFELNNCENVLIEGCEIRNTGRNAINISGKNNTVRNCYIHDTGRGGVFVTGGDFETLAPSNNVIENCRIEYVCNYASTYLPAVWFNDAVGNRASHNQISHGTGIALNFIGNNNIIEYNDVSDWLYEGGDIGVIYCGRSWTSGGNEIRYNYIHGSPGAGDVQAVYMDDGMIGASIYGNVFENVSRGIYLHYGSYHQITNNIFDNCDIGVVIRNPFGGTDQAAEQANKAVDEAFKNGTQNRFDQNGFQTKYNEWIRKYSPNATVYDRLYPYMKDAPYAGLFTPKGNVIERNIFACKTDFQMFDSVKANNSISNNYTLTKEELNNFKLENVNEEYGSKINGFIPIDYKNTGTENKPGLSEIELTTPLNQETNIEARSVEFSWYRVSNATKYRVMIARDAAFSDMVFNGETYKNKNYIKVEDLKYGGKTYYWKVIAYNDYGDVIESKVYSFKTAQKETIDKTNLRNLIEQANDLYNNTTEGDKPGETMIGARDTLNQYTKLSRNVFTSKSATQKSIDKTCDIMSDQIKKFNASKNYVITSTNMSEMLSHKNAWGSTGDILKFDNSKVNLINAGCMGYTGRKVENDELLKFKLKLHNVTDAGWISIGVRAQNALVQPWNTQCYIFLVKESVIELQKFNSGKTFYFSVDNNYLENDVEHEVEFGAITTGDNTSVRVILRVDGETIFDYIDAEYQVDKPGYFAVYSAGGNVEISESTQE